MGQDMERVDEMLKPLMVSRKYNQMPNRILLVGNGFDLACHLPTKYANFIHTVDFLIEDYEEFMNSVGHVFGNAKLQKTDPFIKECYNFNRKLFDQKFLKKEDVEKICSLLKDNEWYHYFKDTLQNENAGWVDFEKEIVRALNHFEEFFKLVEKNLNSHMGFKTTSISYAFVSTYFHYLDEMDFDMPLSNLVVQDYLKEEIPDVEFYNLDYEKIVKELVMEMDDIREALKLYIHCFAEFDLPNPEIRLNPCREYEYVFSLNYTDTIEKAALDLKVIHIHGNTEGEIVLGINENDEDELDNLNTRFIPFKKYYQRVRYKTDEDYLWKIHVMKCDWIDENSSLSSVLKPKEPIKYDLEIFGHSLDVTDKGIIKDLFDLSEHILIYYHEESQIGTYIKNLISIFGKKAFDELRYKKGLSFLPTSACPLFTKKETVE